VGIETIGVLTSGGDAPGMNAAVRAVVRAAIANGMKVYGVRRGYSGLITEDIEEMSIRSVSDIIHRGGTVLYTARSHTFRTEEGMQKAVDVCNRYGIGGLVAIGGDGTFRGARDLSHRGILCVGIPGTIDNDINCSEYTIGYDTAMNTAVEMVDKIRDTSQSHERCTVVEVMGRGCGSLAIGVGVAVGATAVVVPEQQFDLERDIISTMRRTQLTGKKHFIIIVAEGVGKVAELAKEIERITGVESRATVLGHVQRGGSPSAHDRVMASRLGVKAVELLSAGIGNQVVAVKGGRVVSYDIDKALAVESVFDEDLFNIAHKISI
jgi:6-phosphofructokinase 1